MPDDLLMLGFGPRVWLVTVVLLLTMATVTAMSPGFYVSGLLSATDTEREEGMVAIGQDVVLLIKDKPIYERQIEPLIGQEVRLVLVAK